MLTSKPSKKGEQPTMKKIWLLLIAALLLITAGCTKVDKGYEAAKINTLGSDKGEILILGTGRHFYNPIKYDLIINPTFFQEYIWTSNSEEGSQTDESITFQSSNSLKFRANVGAKITLKSGMSGKLYEKYHKTMDQIIITNFRNTLRDAFNRKASERDAEAIYGSGKTKFVEDIEADIRKTWGEYLDIERIYLIGSLDPPKQLVAAINKKIEAVQKARQRENEVAEEKAKADKMVAAARGIADSKMLAADATAYETLAKAEANAAAIKLVQKQLDKSPAYIEYIKANAWDGKLPVYMMGGDAIPMISLQ